jgi:hypothetical protein
MCWLLVIYCSNRSRIPSSYCPSRVLASVCNTRLTLDVDKDLSQEHFVSPSYRRNEPACARCKQTLRRLHVPTLFNVTPPPRGLEIDAMQTYAGAAHPTWRRCPEACSVRPDGEIAISDPFFILSVALRPLPKHTNVLIVALVLSPEQFMLQRVYVTRT